MTSSARLIAAFVVLIFQVLPSLADECDEIAGRLAANVPGLTFKARYDPKPPSAGIEPGQIVEVHYQHRFGGTIEIFCYPTTYSMMPVVTADTDTVYPTAEFLQFVAKLAAAELGGEWKALLPSVSRCHRVALKSRSNSADVELKSGLIHCIVYREPDFKKAQFEISKPNRSRHSGSQRP